MTVKAPDTGDIVSQIEDGGKLDQVTEVTPLNEKVAAERKGIATGVVGALSAFALAAAFSGAPKAGHAQEGNFEPFQIAVASNAISLYKPGQEKKMPSQEFLSVFFLEISGATIDSFYTAWEALPEKHKNNVESTFVNMLPESQISFFRMYERAKTDDPRNNGRIIVSFMSFSRDVETLATYLETGVLPENNQLPNAIDQLERVMRASAIFGNSVSPEFRQKLQEMQDAAYANWLAAERAETAAERAETAATKEELAQSEKELAAERAETAKLLALQERLGGLYNLLSTRQGG